MAGRADGREARSEGVERVAQIVFLLWALGQVARDVTLPTALLFYLPSLAVASLLLLLAGVARWRGRRAGRIAAAACIPLVVGLFVEHHWWPQRAATIATNSAGGAAASLRLLHWNVSGGWAGLDQVARRIAAEHADLVVLSEASERVARAVLAARPGESSKTFGTLTVIAPRIDAADWLIRDRDLQTVAAEVTVGGRSLQLLVVNLASSWKLPRAPALRRVIAATSERHPDLVVGDFNAPRRSWALVRLPDGYRHAYDEAGWGWSASWPVPLPLLSLDHVLVGPRWRATAYRLAGTPWSDHRLQTVDLTAAP